MAKTLIHTVFLLILSVLTAVPARAGDVAENLQAVLDAQPDEVRARYAWRHPGPTLAFFGIEPGMNVVEALPDQGWYTRILLPWLGADGHLTGADYAQEMWPLFGFFGEQFIADKAAWLETWPVQAQSWGGADGPSVAAFKFGSMPADLKGTADAVLLIRALHNLARFESQGGFLTAALRDVFEVLKPGGIVGVVQHEARADMPDEWASGSNGYLKKAWVIARLEAAGFEYLGETEINRNDRDRPTVDDFVWRLPPSFATSRNDPAQRAAMQAVGESNRMTLKFRKPLR